MTRASDGVGADILPAPQTLSPAPAKDTGLPRTARLAVAGVWRALERITEGTPGSPSRVIVFGSFLTGDYGVRSAERREVEVKQEMASRYADPAAAPVSPDELVRVSNRAASQPTPEAAASYIRGADLPPELADIVVKATISDIDGYAVIETPPAPEGERTVETATLIGERYGVPYEDLIPAVDARLFETVTDPYYPTFSAEYEVMGPPTEEPQAVWDADDFA